MVLLNLPFDVVQTFFFVLVRVAAILFSIPFLDTRNIPLLVKAGLAIAVSILIVPRIETAGRPVLDDALAFGLGILGEVAVGMIIGLCVQLFFAGIQLAGQFGGFQMGFAIANVVDPASSLQIPLLAQFLNLFALLIFMALNIHYYFIKALVDSFELIPLWGVHFSDDLLPLIVRLAGNAFIIAVKIGAPVIIALLLTSVALGLIARTVPQMQIFIVAMPLKIILGLFFLGLSLPFFSNFLQPAFKNLGQTIQLLIRMLT